MPSIANQANPQSPTDQHPTRLHSLRRELCKSIVDSSVPSKKPVRVRSNMVVPKGLPTLSESATTQRSHRTSPNLDTSGGMHEGGLDDSRACSETDRRMVKTWHMTTPPYSNANHPKTIHHYTTRAGLQGILESNTLWASHSQFLNDPAELN